MSDSDLYDNELSDFVDDENRKVEKVVKIIKTLKPYQFEPQQEVSETDTVESDTESFEENDENTVRAGCLNWCLGLKCKIEEREIDCLCCQELAALNEKLNVEKKADCITEAEEFKTLCLNKVVFKMC